VFLAPASAALSLPDPQVDNTFNTLEAQKVAEEAWASYTLNDLNTALSNANLDFTVTAVTAVFGADTGADTGSGARGDVMPASFARQQRCAHSHCLLAPFKAMKVLSSCRRLASKPS